MINEISIIHFSYFLILWRYHVFITIHIDLWTFHLQEFDMKDMPGEGGEDEEPPAEGEEGKELRK